jgi:hypothetical protein
MFQAPPGSGETEVEYLAFKLIIRLGKAGRNNARCVRVQGTNYGNIALSSVLGRI